MPAREMAYLIPFSASCLVTSSWMVETVICAMALLYSDSDVISAFVKVSNLIFIPQMAFV